MLTVARIAAIIGCVGVLYSPTVGTIGFIACYVSFLVSGQAWARLKVVISKPSGLWSLAFIGVVLLGMLYAQASWRERWHDVLHWRTILWWLVVMAIFEEECWKRRFFAVFLVGMGIAVVGSFIVASGIVPFWREPNQLLRNFGTQGMAFAVAALICVWIMLEKKPFGPASWIWPVLAVLFITNIVFITDSRSGYAVLLIGIYMLLVWRASWGMRAAISVGLVVAVCAAFLVSPRMQAKSARAVSEWIHEQELESVTSFGSRRIFYKNSLEILEKHWALGVGTGGFPQAYRAQIAGKYDSSDWRAMETTDPHNQYLAIGIQQGVGGVVLFLGWIVAMIRDRGAARHYHRLAVVILVGWCVTSLFSSHFKTFAEGHLLATFLGVLLAADAPPGAAPPVSVTSTEA